MSDLKNTLVKNIIDKRYTRASSDLGVILKDKAKIKTNLFLFKE